LIKRQSKTTDKRGDKLNKRILILFIILVIPLKAFTKTLSVGWELWYPYQYHNKKQELVGLDFDIFNAIIDELKLNVNYTELPWKRHLNYIKTGEMDIAMGSSLTTRRKEFSYFTKPYRKESVKLFVKKGMAEKIHLPSLADLSASDYIIGVEGGYFYGKNYQELMRTEDFQAHISEVVDIEENVTMLLEGHLDGFLVDPITLKAFTDKYSMQGEFEAHDVEIYQAGIHIMLSKKSCSKDLLVDFNHAIESLTKTGKLAEIIAKWTLIQTKKQ